MRIGAKRKVVDIIIGILVHIGKGIGTRFFTPSWKFLPFVQKGQGRTLFHKIYSGGLRN